jgi:uncharacterized protein (TIGR04255 family)
MERLRERFKKEYPTLEESRLIEVQIHEGKVAQTDALAGYKLTGASGADLVLINSNGLATVRLPPYDKWETLLASAQANFETFTKIVGRKTAVRIGVRFVNRIDMPDAVIRGSELSNFFRLGISLPDEIGTAIGAYSLAVTTRDENTGAKLLIQSAIAPPAMLEHTSITLDIDAFWDAEIPQRIDQMWQKTDILRTAKNCAFENSITDKVRELFQ